MRAHRRGERGAAMVEFAIVLPLLVLLVFGVVEFGRAYNAQVSLTNAAREGVREYAITQDADAGIAAASAAATSLDAGLMTFSTSSCVTGQPASLTVQYPFELLIPLFPASSLTLSGEGVMRCGG